MRLLEHAHLSRYAGERGRFGENYIAEEGWGYIMGGRSRFAYRCLKGEYILRGRVDSGSVAYSGEEGGYILKRGVDSGRDTYLRGGGAYSGRVGSILGGRDRLFLSVTYSCRKGEYILEGTDIFWECHFI